MENNMVSAFLPWNDGPGLACGNQYSELASAIVFQAVKDYMKILQDLWKKDQALRKKRKLIIEKAELEEFFHSGWYEFLTDIDPDKLLAGCQQRALEQEKEKIRRQNIKKMKQLQKQQKEE